MSRAKTCRQLGFCACTRMLNCLCGLIGRMPASERALLSSWSTAREVNCEHRANARERENFALELEHGFEM